MSRLRKSSSPVAIELTQRAIADLQQLESFSAQEWGRKAADKYLDDIAAALNRIQENPDILRREPDFAPNLYFYRVRKHVLACDYRQHVVIVLTFLHTSMDIPARLLELEPPLAAETEMLSDKLRCRAKND